MSAVTPDRRPLSRGRSPRLDRRPAGMLAALAAAIGGFGLAGLVIARLTLELNPEVHRSLGDSAALLVAFFAVYALLGLVPGLFAAVTLGLARIVRLPRPLLRFLGVAAVSTLLGAPLVYVAFLPELGLGGHVIADHFFGAGARGVLLILLGAALALTVLGFVLLPLLRALTKRRTGGVPAVLAVLWLLSVSAVVAWSLLGRPPGDAGAATASTDGPLLESLPPAPAEEPPPVALLVVDGADYPAMIAPMVARGELPTFARLMEEGTWGLLESVVPTRSHMIWTSIITGKVPEQHGIRNFTTFRLPGLDQTIQDLPLHSGLNKVLPALWSRIPGMPALHAPYTSNQRRVEALWNIVDDYWPVGVYRWLVTYPAEAVNGFYVSGGMRQAQFVHGFAEEAERGFPEAAVHPDDLFAGLGLPEKPELTPADLEPYVGPEYASFPMDDPRMEMLADHETDPTVEVVPALIDKYDARFTAAYFYSVDSHGHLFSPAHGTDEPFAPAVEQGYRHTDRMLGRFLARLPEETNVLVISDHGFDYEVNHHIFAPPGVIFAVGPAFEPGRRVDELDVYDIAPLVLRLLDLPVPTDMEAVPEGEYEALLSAEFVREHPEVRIATWETGRERVIDEPVESALDEEMTDVLKSLGYIE